MITPEQERAIIAQRLDLGKDWFDYRGNEIVVALEPIDEDEELYMQTVYIRDGETFTDLDVLLDVIDCEQDCE